MEILIFTIFDWLVFSKHNLFFKKIAQLNQHYFPARLYNSRKIPLPKPSIVNQCLGKTHSLLSPINSTNDNRFSEASPPCNLRDRIRKLIAATIYTKKCDPGSECVPEASKSTGFHQDFHYSSSAFVMQSSRRSACIQSRRSVFFYFAPELLKL